MVLHLTNNLSWYFCSLNPPKSFTRSLGKLRAEFTSLKLVTRLISYCIIWLFLVPFSLIEYNKKTLEVIFNIRTQEVIRGHVH